ncbi:DUF3592 domain-containing protein [Dactylosporangium siamense]
MAGTRGRRRRRVREGRQDRVLARANLLRGPKPGRRGRLADADRPGKVAWFAVVLGIVLGVVLLANGTERWYDHLVIQQRGQPAVAHIVGVDNGGKGVWVQVRFTTGAGMEVVTEVPDPPTDARLTLGGEIPVRYDPDDPKGRVTFAGDDQAVISRWFFIVSGTVLLGLSGFAAVTRLRTTRRPA